MRCKQEIDAERNTSSLYYICTISVCTRTEKLNESQFKVLQTELSETRIGTDRIIVRPVRGIISGECLVYLPRN